MCGIFGFAGSPEVADAIDLDVALRALRHRGPDGEGTFRSNGGTAAVAIAHTRLAIIDLSPLGQQPMRTDDGRYTITYNGEVYNFRAIRAELEAAGHGFRSATDTEVVLHAYAEWGADCVQRFRGMFAFAIWDAREETLFFARDRFGIKPFYYRVTPRGFAFASEVRALLETRLVDRRLSADGLASYLTWGSVEDPLTLVDGVLSLLPGHRGRWRNGELQIERYWELSDAPVRHVAFEEAVEELRPILRESIRKELVADVPLGVFLSGGIDSSAIVAIASEQSDRPIHTFTATFDEEAYDEAPFAKEVAGRFGCVHTAVHLAPAKALQELEAAMASYDQPSADGINTWFVAKAAREAGLSVALSGLGGDEIFGGYANFRRFGALMKVARALGPLGIGALFGQDSFRGTSMPVKKLGEILDARGRAPGTYRALRGMFTVGQVRRMVPHRGAASANGEAVALGDAVSQYSRFELTHYLRNTLLRDTDQMSMAHSLEMRVPLLDHVVAEKVVSLAGAVKVAPSGPNKRLLVAAAPPLPESVTHRAKRGFTLPFESWVKNEARADLERMLAHLDPAVPWPSIGDRAFTGSRVLALAALGSWSRRWLSL